VHVTPAKRAGCAYSALCVAWGRMHFPQGATTAPIAPAGAGWRFVRVYDSARRDGCGEPLNSICPTPSYGRCLHPGQLQFVTSSPISHGRQAGAGRLGEGCARERIQKPTQEVRSGAHLWYCGLSAHRKVPQ